MKLYFVKKASVEAVRKFEILKSILSHLLPTFTPSPPLPPRRTVNIVREEFVIAQWEREKKSSEMRDDDVKDLRKWGGGERTGWRLRTKLQINILNSLLILFTFLKRDERFRFSWKDFGAVILSQWMGRAATTTSNFDINLYYFPRLISFSLAVLLENLENKYNLEGFSARENEKKTKEIPEWG